MDRAIGATHDESPPYKLFSTGQAAAVSFLGSFLATGLLMASNYSRVGKSSAARLSVVGGMLATLAIMVLAYLLPDGTPSSVFVIVTLVAARGAADSLQGPLLEEHGAQGGQVESGWKAFAVGLGACALALGMVVALAMGAAFFTGF